MTGPDEADGGTPDDAAAAEPHPGRWQLIRDSFAFQLKLVADGLRDVVFAPVSIVLTLIDLLTGGDRFYRLLQLGRRTETWINLFGRYSGRGRGIDDAVNRVEELISEQYKKGGITASAKRTVDKTLNKLGSEKTPDQD